MVLLQKLTFLSLALSLVVAKNIPASKTEHNIIRDVRMHVGVRDDGIVTDEEVELNYEQNYDRVSTPGRSGTSPLVMIHDYNWVDGIVDSDGLDSYVAEFYKLLPFALNRTSLSPAIQQECPGDILAVSLQDTRVQQEAYDYVHSNLGNRSLVMTEIFQPRTTPPAPVREKRFFCAILVVIAVVAVATN